MKVIKRDGRAVEFKSDKISIAIEKANREVANDKRANKQEVDRIIEYIEALDKKRILVEDIQDIIEEKLMEYGKYDLAKKYIVYRYTRALVRKQNTTDESILGLIKNANNVSSMNKNSCIVATMQRNLIAGEVSKDLTKRILLPEKITKAHEEGILYFHATEYFLQPLINSSFINVGDMLNNGTVINNIQINQPKTFQMACTILAQIIAIVAESQYGEQYINIKYLGEYLRKSYNKYVIELKEISGVELSETTIETFVQKRIEDEVKNGIYTIKSQIESLVNMCEANFIVGIIVDDENNDEYHEENQMIISELLKSDIHNARIITNIDTYNGTNFEGFFNYGVVSINLPQISILANGDEKVFWELLNSRLELCYEALMCKHYALLGTISNVSPIHWQSGAIARLKSNERIDRYLRDGYSSLSLRICWIR